MGGVHQGDPDGNVGGMTAGMFRFRDSLRHIRKFCACAEQAPQEDLVALLNTARKLLSRISPFRGEPVDCVLWVPFSAIEANDYNPNTVAPPEMDLLHTSILEDGYTQPIVGFDRGDAIEVVDGFHRNRVAREREDVGRRVHGHLPITIINTNRSERGSRIASTIRHNRARGKHRVDAMSDIVVELKNRNWTNERIAKALGMDDDEVLRLCQITGLADLFSDQEFSKSWDVAGEVTAQDFEELSDEITLFTDEEKKGFRTVNTSDENRIFHTYDKWECYAAGMHKTTIDGMTKDECTEKYCGFLRDTGAFSAALERVILEWKHSCEHYLTNDSMNRIAWLGQAAMCYATGIPAVFRGGFHLLSADEQNEANETALIYLNKWLLASKRPGVSMEEAGIARQSDIY